MLEVIRKPLWKPFNTFISVIASIFAQNSGFLFLYHFRFSLPITSCDFQPHFYLRRSRQVLELWELLLLLGGGAVWWTTSGSLAFLFSHPKFSLGWDPGLFDQISLRGEIRGLLTKFLFGVGSVGFCQCRRSLNKVCSCSKWNEVKRYGERTQKEVNDRDPTKKRHICVFICKIFF